MRPRSWQTRGLAAAALGVVMLLGGCALPPAAPGLAATQPASPTAGPRLATVTGTGQFGLNVRKQPGLNAERIATVPDGYQAVVLDGPVSQDGTQWYRLQGPDVSGWASAAYLSLSTGTAGVTPTPASSPTPAASLQAGPSNLAGVLVQQELRPALDHLSASPTGEAVLKKAATATLRITVAHLPNGSEGGEFSTLGHSIRIADGIMKESVDVQSAVLAHELQHAADILVDHNAPESAQACVNLELRAFQTQEKVWLELTKPSPPKTDMETEFDTLSHVVNTPTFAQKLATLYASECSAYAKS